MPKMKSHKGTQKRLRLTKNGKVMRMKQGGSHLRRRKRRTDEYSHPISSTNKKMVSLIKMGVNG
ncbi:MAG: 50S ribosomal protein L35 [Caldilineaceae bacterium]|nr:50S ribosomal protein L35 [Caldilineaceae bacterium]